MEPQVTSSGSPPKLRRSRSDRVIGGVCGGIGRHLGVDSVLVRVVVVVLVVFGGSGILLYLLAWLIIPEEAEGEQTEPTHPMLDSRGSGRFVVGAVLVGIGALMLVNQIVPRISDLIGPLVLVAAGLAIVFLGVNRPDSAEAPDAEPPDPDLRDFPPPDTRARVVSTGDLESPTDEPIRRLGRIVLGSLLIVGGALWLLDLGGVLELDWRVVLPVALIVVGVATVVLAWTGQHTGGLIGWGVVLAVMVAVTSILPGRISASIGERIEQPETIAELERDYALGIGTMTVDLRGIDLDRDRTVEASVGMGELVVLVSPDIALDISSRVGAGEAVALDRVSSGVGVTLGVAFPAEDGAVGVPTLTLDLSVGLGKIEVRR